MELSLVTNVEANQNITADVVFEYNKDGTPKTGLKIVGPDSVQYLNAQVANRVRNRKRNATGQTIDLKTDEGQLEIENVTKENLFSVAVAVTVDWFGFTNGGQPAAFDIEQVKKIFAAKPSWQDKVIAALDREADFLPKAEAA